jgi:hypothetical protein
LSGVPLCSRVVERVAATVMLAGRAEYRPEIRCRRLRCGECRHGWTALPRGFVPRRHHQPTVVAHAVAQYHRGGTQDEVARALLCSRRSVARWLAWISEALNAARGAWRRFAGRVAQLVRATAETSECAATIPALAR